MVTNKPLVDDQTYFPKSLSINDWDIPSVTGYPEYYYYSHLNGNGPALDAWQVTNMTSSSYSQFGLNNTYNGYSIYSEMFQTLYGGFTLCANEDEMCQCTGTVMYGYPDSFSYAESYGEIYCSYTIFGDVYPGVYKYCSC